MRTVLALVVVGAALTACGDDGTADSAGDRPTIVVTTSILGDIVGEVVGDAAEVEVVMPRGADPHEFAPSARQVEAMADADLLVVNGAGYEEGLGSAIDAAASAGVPVFTVTDHVAVLDGDPHVWTDPRRIATAVDALGGVLADRGITSAAAAYAEELAALDAEVEAMLREVPADRRVLVTNHEVLTYFADRYGFEVVGTVIPSASTGAEPSAAGVEALAEVIAEHGVPAIFVEATSSASVADALAESVGVDVVTLFAESLGEPGSGADTYLGMVRTNAERIREALAG